MLPDWRRLFPEADYRFQMSLRPGDEAGFWQAGPDAGTILRERRRWLEGKAERFAACLPEGASCVGEAIEHLSRYAGNGARALASELGGDAPASAQGHDRASAGGLAAPVTASRLIALGRQVEPDWVVLSPDAGRDFPIVGGVVVFPSSWALAEKLGRPLHEVHAPAPGLNAALGKSISTFLSRLQPGAAWERENWGLAADDALNHHPDVSHARLDGSARLHTTWLRLERQILLRLAGTGAILFGIRISNHRLDALAAIPGLAARLSRALMTMPEEIARYKGLTEARLPLAISLSAHSAAD